MDTEFGYAVQLQEWIGSEDTLESCFINTLGDGYTREERISDFLSLCGGDVFKTKTAYNKYLKTAWLNKLKCVPYSEVGGILRELYSEVNENIEDEQNFTVIPPKVITNSKGDLYLLFRFKTKITNACQIRKLFGDVRDKLSCPELGFRSWKVKGFLDAYPVKVKGTKITPLLGDCDHDWVKTSDLMNIGGKVVRARKCSICEEEQLNEVQLNKEIVTL